MRPLLAREIPGSLSSWVMLVTDCTQNDTKQKALAVCSRWPCSVAGLVGPVCCTLYRGETALWMCNFISVWQHVALSKGTRPWHVGKRTLSNQQQQQQQQQQNQKQKKTKPKKTKQKNKKTKNKTKQNKTNKQTKTNTHTHTHTHKQTNKQTTANKTLQNKQQQK